jgi:hypothetical protein
LLNELFGNTTLTLAKRQDLQAGVHAPRFGKTHEVGNRVGTWGEHEDDGSCVLRIIESPEQIERRGLNESLTKLSLDELLDSIHQLFFSKDLKNHEFLEGSELGLKFTR